MNRWMNRWMYEWMNGWIDGWMDEWRMDGWMNEWMDRMDGWIDGCMNGWILNNYVHSLCWDNVASNLFLSSLVLARSDLNHLLEDSSWWFVCCNSLRERERERERLKQKQGFMILFTFWIASNSLWVWSSLWVFLISSVST